MISLISYLFESLTRNDQGLNPEENPFKTALHSYTGIRTQKDVKDARDTEAGEWAKKIAKQRTDFAKEKADYGNKWKSVVEKMKGKNATIGKAGQVEPSGTEAAGIAMNKGAKAAGEAMGGLGKKVAEFAGEHPAAAALAGGLGIGAILAKRRKNSNNM